MPLTKIKAAAADSINTKSASDPALNTNPSAGVGHIWLNTSSGEMYCCTDATTDANVWVNIGDGTGDVKPFTPTAATGGTVTTDGDYKVHTFTSSGTFTVSAVGTEKVEYLVVAGGGGAGDWGGGGGGGGYRTATDFTVTAQAYNIVVGAGGTGQGNATAGTQGTNSTFSTISSTGGGGGGNDTGGNYATTGGSGGGGSYFGAPGTQHQGAAGNAGGYDPVEGYDGGTSTSGIVNDGNGSGGGGAGGVGGSGTSSEGGDGGIGRDSSISGSSVGYAGGGGGGSSEGNPGTATHGGGNGGVSNNASHGTVNTGGGAGACTGSGDRQGGSGIVIIKYKFQ